MVKKNAKAFKLIAVSMVCITVFSLDYLVGYINEIRIYREITFTFRTEVAPLITNTLHLLPKLDDSYPPEGPDQVEPRHVRTDKYGLIIGPDYGVKPELSEKILFLGGSTTENNEVDEAYRFPYLSAKIVSAVTNKPYYGVNGGVRGHTSQNSINLYLNHPAPYIAEAEKVVVMQNINDRLLLAVLGSYKSNIGDPPQISLKYASNQATGVFYSIWKWLSFQSNIVYLADSVIKQSSVGENPSGALINERTLDNNPNINISHLHLFKQNLKTLAAIIKSRNKIPYLMTQPLGKDSKGQDMFNDAIRQVAFDDHISLIDLARYISKQAKPDKLFFPDGIHFNNQGSSIAAEYIANELLIAIK